MDYEKYPLLAALWEVAKIVAIVTVFLYFATLIGHLSGMPD